MILRLIELIKLFYKDLREGLIRKLGLRGLGLKFTLKAALSYVGIKVYSTIKYPIIGIKVKVRPNIFWKYLEKGRWELNCIKFLSNIIGEGQTILDVGAWIGPYTLLFSKLMQGTGQVYAFDPDLKALDILRDNIEKNCLTNVHIEKICMSNFIGKAKLRAYRFGVSDGSIYREHIRYKQGTDLREITAETTTIDRYCEENGILPDGIKIDVEGAEGLVIEGCRNIIRKCSPWILLEFHGSYMPEKERRINWHKIVDSAKKVIFIDAIDCNVSQYHYGSEVKSVPNRMNFHVFIKY